MINHGYVSLDQFARIVINYASVKIWSSERDIRALVRTLEGLSGYSIPEIRLPDDIEEGERATEEERQENSIQREFQSSCAPANGPVNPAILEQMKTYLWLLGFRPAGQSDILVLEEIQGNPEEWVLPEIAERFTYPGIRSF